MINITMPKIEDETIIPMKISEQINAGGFIPTGTLEITENGLYNVSQYANADVSVEGVQPTGKIEITENADNIDVAQYATAKVNVPQGIFPSGTKEITENGLSDVTEYENVNVQVPQPSGKKIITENGTDIDISQYATADIAVPQGVFPTGKKTVTENGTDIDISQYALLDVQVPSVQPSGTINILSDVAEKTVDVSAYANAKVTNPLLDFIDVETIMLQQNATEVSFHYTPNRHIEEIIFVPILVTAAVRLELSFYFRHSMTDDTKYHAYSTFIGNDGFEYFTTSNIAEPVFDAENQTITIVSRGSAWTFNAGSVYFAMVIYTPTT